VKYILLVIKFDHANKNYSKDKVERMIDVGSEDFEGFISQSYLKAWYDWILTRS